MSNTNTQNFTSQDAYNLLVAAISEFGYSEQDIIWSHLHELNQRADIQIGDFTYLSAGLDKHQNFMFTFEDSFDDEHTDYPFDGTLDDLCEVIEIAQDEGYRLY